MLFDLKIVFVLLCILFSVRGEHEDDGVCICSGCPNIDCENDFRPTCEDVLVGHDINCVDNETTAECIEFVCDGDDGEDAPDLCDDFCETLNCDNATLVCESNLEFPCFHEDTVINYRGDKYIMEDFFNENEPECRIPHVVEAIGLVISTSCDNIPLRVTSDHLVYSSNGLLEASNLKKGDVLFSDFDHELEENNCIVQWVRKEERLQKYFGLNCLTSEVLANGIHTSTFGTYHTIPAIYMYNIGSILGIDMASQLGDTLSQLYSKLVHQ